MRTNNTFRSASGLLSAAYGKERDNQVSLTHDAGPNKHGHDLSAGSRAQPSVNKGYVCMTAILEQLESFGSGGFMLFIHIPG